MASLTKKQRAAIKRAPRAQRRKLAASYLRQDIRRGRMPRGKNGPRLAGIVQNVGRAPRRGFGGSRSHGHAGFNAFCPAHLALPRATGPYSIVRTTTAITTTDPLMLFGIFSPQLGGSGEVSADNGWSNLMAYGVKDLATAINGMDNVAKYVFSNMADPSWDYSRMAPAAFSVQIMNSEAVPTSSGITYFGRIKAIPGFDADLTLTGKGFGDITSIACNGPRLCSAAKLAFRGVQVNAVPYNMSALAQFNGREKITETSAATLTKDDPIPLIFSTWCVVNGGLDLTHPTLLKLLTHTILPVLSLHGLAL